MMDTRELMAKVRTIEIKSRGLSRNVFAGQYHSAFRGRGMSFAEVRDYQPGDDVRDIDWNVTARFGHPYVKVFEEERELTVVLLIDVSGSLFFGTQRQSKHDQMVELAATLALSAIQNGDKIGAIFFTDKIEKYIPPKKGRKHALLLIRELLTTEGSSSGTDLNVALEFLFNVVRRRSTAFLISDFVQGNSFEKNLQMVADRHDLIAIQSYDRMAEQLPDVGLLQLYDAESGEHIMVDTHSKAVRRQHAENWEHRQERLKTMFNKAKTDFVSISTADDYVTALQELFDRRK